MLGEQTAVHSAQQSDQKFKTFWPRFFAAWIDAIVMWPIVVINMWVYAEWVHSAWAGTPVLVWFVVATLAFPVYSVLMHGARGQTLGKMAMGVKVLAVSEDVLSFRQAFLRDSIYIVFAVAYIVLVAPHVLDGHNPDDLRLKDFTTAGQMTMAGILFMLHTFVEAFWVLAELLTMLTNKKRRALHDFIAGSVVVRFPLSTD